ncbi:hypothetical protein Pmani_012374 [Petrolisthes manimaculis]|uniref:Uncharacterized protein n=1 Tax=Petrolisthes manimaculis TaxID=1843537 RepID=A0AAE1UAJ6_9EUCA|nr:hypothetical protein Pmani_012374 [Petrolisthes manimaculis]
MVIPVTYIVPHAPLVVTVVVSHGEGVDPDGGATIPTGGPPGPLEWDHRSRVVQDSSIVGFCVCPQCFSG